MGHQDYMGDICKKDRQRRRIYTHIQYINPQSVTEHVHACIYPGIWSLIIFVWSGLVAGLVRLEHLLSIYKVVWFPVLIWLFPDVCCYVSVSLSDLHLCCSIIVWAPKDTLGEGEGSWQQTEQHLYS